MPSFLQNLITAHSLLVAIAIFTALSTILTAVGSYLKSVGDQVPGIIGTLISYCGSIIHFLNGIQGGGSNS